MCPKDSEQSRVFRAEEKVKRPVGPIKEIPECQTKSFKPSEVETLYFCLFVYMFVFSRGMMLKRFSFTRLICLQFLVTNE